MRDLTKDYDYEKLIREEKSHYSGIEVTADLREGGAHAAPAWEYYWARVNEVLRVSPYFDMASFLSSSLAHLDRPIQILSLGSGYCGHELKLARRLVRPYLIRCTDINEEIFASAQKQACNEGLALEFTVADLNFIDIEPCKYDLIFAHAALHHVINLERLFEQVAGGLSPHGILHVVEVVGKNRILIWKENERFANALLDTIQWVAKGRHIYASESAHGTLPDIMRFTKRLLQPLLLKMAHGMEGVRQEDILPLINESFVPLFEHRHGAFIRFICTNPALSGLFDLSSIEGRNALDFLIEADQATVRNNILRPLELWGIYKSRSTAREKSAVSAPS